MTQLRFTSPKLAKELGDRLSIDPTTEETIKIFRAGLNSNHSDALVVNLGRSSESERKKCMTEREDFVSLGFRDAFDGQESFPRLICYCLDCIIASVDKFLNIGLRETMFGENSDRNRTG